MRVARVAGVVEEMEGGVGGHKRRCSLLKGCCGLVLYAAVLRRPPSEICAAAGRRGVCGCRAAVLTCSRFAGRRRVRAVGGGGEGQRTLGRAPTALVLLSLICDAGCCRAHLAHAMPCRGVRGIRGRYEVIISRRTRTGRAACAASAGLVGAVGDGMVLESRTHGLLVLGERAS